MSDENIRWYGWTMWVIGFGIGAIVVLVLASNEIGRLQGEAVTRGYAEWKVDPKTGTTTWMWTEPKGEKETK